MIELLQEAVRKVQSFLGEGNTQELLQLLAECQDAAIALGSHIEKLYGMQTKTVAALEQYCNALYQMSIEAAYEELAHATQLVAETYETEFPERSEVVFLPYNASMWDSLDSNT